MDSYLDQLSHLVDAHGIGAFESDIARLVVQLRSCGYHCPVVDVLADRTAPAIARERAFAQALVFVDHPLDRPLVTAA